MSKTVKFIAALSLVAFAAACAQQEEPAPMEEMAPVAAEPTYNKV